MTLNPEQPLSVLQLMSLVLQMISAELQKFTSLFQACIEDHSDDIFDALPVVNISQFNRAPVQGLVEAEPSEGDLADQVNQTELQFCIVFFVVLCSVTVCMV